MLHIFRLEAKALPERSAKRSLRDFGIRDRLAISVRIRSGEQRVFGHLRQVLGSQIDTLLQTLAFSGVRAEIIAPSGGKVSGGGGNSLSVDKTLVTAASVFYDGIIALGNNSQRRDLLELGGAKHFVSEAFMHGKTIGALGAGVSPG
jgi:hypothetical protein